MSTRATDTLENVALVALLGVGAYVAYKAYDKYKKLADAQNTGAAQALQAARDAANFQLPKLDFSSVGTYSTTAPMMLGPTGAALTAQAFYKKGQQIGSDLKNWVNGKDWTGSVGHFNGYDPRYMARPFARRGN